MELHKRDLKDVLAETRESLNLYIFQNQFDREHHLKAKRSFIASSSQYKRSSIPKKIIRMRDSALKTKSRCTERLETQSGQPNEF